MKIIPPQKPKKESSFRTRMRNLLSLGRMSDRKFSQKSLSCAQIPIAIGRIEFRMTVDFGVFIFRAFALYNNHKHAVYTKIF